MYKPNIKLTERARLASPHPLTGIDTASKLIFLNKVIAFGTFVVEKGYTLDSSSFHFAI